jgi:hypothetical protein
MEESPNDQDTFDQFDDEYCGMSPLATALVVMGKCLWVSVVGILIAFCIAQSLKD